LSLSYGWTLRKYPSPTGFLPSRTEASVPECTSLLATAIPENPTYFLMIFFVFDFTAEKMAVRQSKIHFLQW
jgi:hypothetical protein